jgi:catalase
MAIRILAPDDEEWRSGTNNSPDFDVSTSQAFYQMTVAQDIDPATDESNPAAMTRSIVIPAAAKRRNP